MSRTELMATYPQLYGNLPWGIECGDGWAQLLDDLSQVLVGLGGVEVVQVKEKFGTLRFYVDGEPPPGAWAAIRFAERLSASTCELCGREGRLRQGNWWATRCDRCVK